MAKIGLCIQGGGSRGTYAAGPLSVLMQNQIWADVVIGTSCGGLMGCNYVSKETDRAEKQTILMCDDKEFFRPFEIFSKKRTMFNYEHLVNEIGHGILPFAFDVFAKNPCKFLVVATNCLTGKADFLDKTMPGFLPTALAATGALPLTSEPVMFLGIPYLDGGIACPIGYEKALEEGCDKVIVIATRARGYRKGPIKHLTNRLVKRMYRDYPAFLDLYPQSPEVYNAQMDEMERLEKEGRLFVIYPSKAPKVSHAETDKKILIELMQLGKNDALEALPSLKSYLSK